MTHKIDKSLSESDSQQLIKNFAALASLAASLFSASFSFAAPPVEGEVPVQSVAEPSTWETIKKRTRVRTYTEFMTPSFQGSSPNVPSPDGGVFAPTNTFNIFWADYEVVSNWRVVYWQRFNLNFVSDKPGQGMNIVARNPRFAIRRTQVFDNPNLTTAYDFYAQPGLAPEATTAEREFEFGFRTNHNYVFPHSNWNIGAITELTASPMVQDGANTYGWAMAWISYEMSPKWATQHYFTVNFKHQRGDAWDQLKLDLPMPYTQNGISWTVNEQIWTALFLNNYLTAPPTLQNTWASFWLSLTIL